MAQPASINKTPPPKYSGPLSPSPPNAQYHLETVNGQQVLVNDQTGNVAITDQSSGRIIGEVQRSQLSGTQSAATPNTNGLPPYVPGGGLPDNGFRDKSAPSAGNAIVTNPPPPGTQPSTWTPDFPVPGMTGTAPPVANATTTNGPSGPTGPGAPGTDTYDWWAVNTALQGAQMGDGSWNIAGANHAPVASAQYVPDPGYNKLLTAQENADAGHPEEFVQKPGSDYVIGVANSRTGELVKIHLTKSAPDANGNYTYSVVSRESQGKLDTAQPGYTGVQREAFSDGHEELWGTNTQTGAFEKMPQSPANLGNTKGWNDVRQVETTDENGQRVLVWVGTNPEGKPLQRVPDALPPIPVAKYVPGSVKQVTKNGQQVYVGQNPVTGKWEDIPELGSEAAPITTTTAGGNVYTQNPKAGQPGEPSFIPASGIAQPKEGDRQWTNAGGGYVKRQVYTGGAWHDVGPDDPEGGWQAVDPTTVRAAGALPPKGTKIWQPVPGTPDTLVQVTADGNGGFTYDTGPNGEPPPTKKIPGIAQPQNVPGQGTGEFLPQRRDPVTGALLPAEKNIAWQPTNVGDRVRQLQDMARAKQQELHQQRLSGAIASDEEADAQFKQWWDDYVAPAKLEIDQAAQQKQIDQTRQIQEQNRANYATALEAGRNAAGNVQAQMPYMVGPGFSENLNKIAQGWTSGKPIQGLDLGSMLTFQMPDLNAISQQVTSQALAHISPTAAQNMNQATGPNVQNFGPGVQSPPDYTQGLQTSRYMPSQATTTIAPDGTVTINHANTPPAPAQPAAPPAPVLAPASLPTYKPGWPGSDPRLSGTLDPTTYTPSF